MRKILLILFVFICFTILVGCGNNTEQPSDDDYSNEQRHQIYLLAQTSGYEGTYEQWLASIRGDAIVLTVSSDGYLMWKYKTESDDNYRMLYNLAGLKGQDGNPGEKGEDGHTPQITIGNNGNWFVDNVDTGVKAQGEKAIMVLMVKHPKLKSVKMDTGLSMVLILE